MTDSDQLVFWRGEFGNAYSERNAAQAKAMANRRAMWRRILEVTDPAPASILEIGANVGLNLRALSEIADAELHAVEPNEKARDILQASGLLAADHVHDGSAAALPMGDGSVEFAFTCGVLIHISPDDLLPSCREIHRASSRFILCAEYFNPTPVEEEYRGHSGVLFKRDFGSFWLDNFTDLELVDYGFFWKRATGLDDLTWWLLRKS